MTPKTSSEERVARQPLNPNAQKWVAALRSGKYEQGKGFLCMNNRYCCLGIAADLAAEEGVIPPPRAVELHDVDNDLKVRKVFDGVEGWLTRPVMAWLGLRDSCGRIDAETSLARLNDEYGKTFSEIADIIESQPEGLFVEVKP